MNLLPLLLVFCLGCRPAETSHPAFTVRCSVEAAVPNDGRDDRAAIQDALDTQGCAFLPAGTYDIDTPKSPTLRRPYDMLKLRDGQRLYGEGVTTSLVFRGDAGGQDWHGIALEGVGAKLHDLSLDTAALFNTIEQTHAIRVTGPAAHPEVFSVVIEHPQRGLPGGDCIQLVGYAATPISGARIYGNVFSRCDRSGIAIHSGAYALEISDNTFVDSGDQDIDGEGSGDNAGWLIANNTFATSSNAQGGIAIEIQASTDVRLTGNSLTGRGVFAYGCSSCEIDHNIVLRGERGGGIGALEILKGSVGVRIHDNVIQRAAAAGVGAVIHIGPHGTQTPSNIVVANNMIVQEAAGNAIVSSGVVGLRIEHNSITYNGPVDGVYMGVDAQGSTSTRTDQIEVSGNHFAGPMLASIRVSGSYAGCGSLALSDNAGDGGLLCEGVSTGSKVMGPVTTRRNTWAPNRCGPPGFVKALD